MNSSNPFNIILVEDDLELAELIRDFLQNYEFTIEIVSDGITAVNEILSKQPDLVILDIMLPGQSGMDVCRSIRSNYHGMILMQTALDDDIDQVMGLELGADDYIVKPIKSKLLILLFISISCSFIILGFYNAYNNYNSEYNLIKQKGTFPLVLSDQKSFRI